MSPSRRPSHVDHTEILRRCDADVAERLCRRLCAAAVPRCAIVSQTVSLSDDYDVYVYSTLMDMDNGLYRYRDSDWVVPYGDFKLNITDESTLGLGAQAVRVFRPRFPRLVSREFHVRGIA